MLVLSLDYMWNNYRKSYSWIGPLILILIRSEYALKTFKYYLISYIKWLTHNCIIVNLHFHSIFNSFSKLAFIGRKEVTRIKIFLYISPFILYGLFCYSKDPFGSDNILQTKELKFNWKQARVIPQLLRVGRLWRKDI